MKGIIFEEPVPTLRYLLNIFKKMLGIESRSDLEDADLSEFVIKPLKFFRSYFVVSL